MDLPFPNSSQPVTPAPNTPAMPSNPGPGRNWLRLGIAAVVIVAVIVGAFFGGRTIYRATHHSHTISTAAHSSGNSHNATNNMGEPGTAGGSSSASSTGSSGTAAGSGSSASTGAAGSSTHASTNSSNTPTTLTNTGPGQTIGLFIGSILAGAAAYQLALRKRRLH